MESNDDWWKASCSKFYFWFMISKNFNQFVSHASRRFLIFFEFYLTPDFFSLDLSDFLRFFINVKMLWKWRIDWNCCIVSDQEMVEIEQIKVTWCVSRTSLTMTAAWAYYSLCLLKLFWIVSRCTLNVRMDFWHLYLESESSVSPCRPAPHTSLASIY